MKRVALVSVLVVGIVGGILIVRVRENKSTVDAQSPQPSGTEAPGAVIAGIAPGFRIVPPTPSPVSPSDLPKQPTPLPPTATPSFVGPQREVPTTTAPEMTSLGGGAAPIPGSVTVQPGGDVMFVPKGQIPAGETGLVVQNHTNQPAKVTYDGRTLTFAGASGSAAHVEAVTGLSARPSCTAASNQPQVMTCAVVGPTFPIGSVIAFTATGR